MLFEAVEIIFCHNLVTGKEKYSRMEGHGAAKSSATTATMTGAVAESTPLQIPTQNRLDILSQSSPLPEFITVTMVSTLNQVQLVPIAFTDTMTVSVLETRTVLDTVTTTSISTLYLAYGVLPTSRPPLAHSPSSASGSVGMQSAAPAPTAGGLWQQQQTLAQNSARATIIGLSIWSALASILLLLVLSVFFVRRRRWMAPLHHSPIAPTDPALNPFDDIHRSSHEPEKEPAIQPETNQSIASPSRFSDASNIAVLPSIPSRARSMISTRYTPEQSTFPADHTVSLLLPIRQYDSLAGANKCRPVPSNPPSLSDQPLSSYFSRLRQLRLTGTRVSPPQGNTSNFVLTPGEQRRGSVDLEREGYPSSVVATVDSVNSSRLARSDTSTSRPTLSPNSLLSTDRFYLDRV
ncbi:hypothetical protein BDY19DRAFT_237315 [Irpex rosettiformis]|uniref:Uncharacterized protein n=1 Tax=Irpex rosettiformis TaxID=378272 RepID=A0ACB8U005_9APHY|nr:hypothetical protein BDY19DRAFT_237315 [Irpex rosettiformis]